MVVFGGSYGIGGDIADLARKHGAEVRTYSRSSTGTHVERREHVAVIGEDGVVPAGHLPPL